MTPHQNKHKARCCRMCLRRGACLVSGQAGHAQSLNDHLSRATSEAVAYGRFSAGFSLIELLVAAAIFTFVVTGVGGLFIQALDMQRRASGIQKIQENALYVLESITREVRVSIVTSVNTTSCTAPYPQETKTLVIQHPVNGTVTYEYSKVGDVGAITRNGEQITSADVDIISLAFCVSGSGADGKQARVTIPMTLQVTAGRSVNSVSLQTTIVSRDLSVDFSQ